MNLRGVARLFLAICLILAVPPTGVQANKGEPGSPEFGYGGRIDINETGTLQTTLTTAGNLHFDWLSAEFNWAQSYSGDNKQPDWTALDRIMEFAEAQDMVVMLSLTKAPVWAMGSTGPDAEKTAAMAVMLTQRYPHALRAIELFPGANTQTGWGAVPNAAAYMAVYNAVNNKLSTDVFLVAGGLRISPLSAANNTINDTDFLRNLYAADKNGILRVISLQYEGLSSEPLLAQTNQNQPVLRHYEEVRKIMTETGHAKGLIWITRLTLENEQMTSENRITWFSQAYQQIRAQLYIGTAFFQVAEAPVKLTAHEHPVVQNNAAPAGETNLSFIFSNWSIFADRN